MSELSPLEKGWLWLLVLGSSSLLATLLLPFPSNDYHNNVTTKIMILPEQHFAEL